MTKSDIIAKLTKTTYSPETLLTFSKIELLEMLANEEAPINNPTKKEKKMTDTAAKTGMTKNFIVKSNDAKLWKYGKKTKPTTAAPAVEAVAGVKAVKYHGAIPAVKADKAKGIKAQKMIPAVQAVDAVKAIKAKPAVEAGPGSVQLYFSAKTEEVANELVARFADMGLSPDNVDDKGCAVYFDDNHKHFFFSFTAETDRQLRDAFKTAKAKYNAPGLKALDDAKKHQQAEAKAANMAKVREKKEAAEAEKAAKAKNKKDKEEAEKEDKEEGDGWPE